MGLLGGATSLVEMIVKKFGDDIDGATQELVRMGGFPEPVARRIATGELPMDEASRVKRADEQGYGDVLYHGSTDPNIKEVSAGKFGARNEDATKTGMWMSESPYIANGYSGGYSDNGVVYPLRYKSDEPAFVRGGDAHWSRLDDNSLINMNVSNHKIDDMTDWETGEDIPGKWDSLQQERVESTLEELDPEGSYTDHNFHWDTNTVAKMAKDNWNDSVTFFNVTDPGPFSTIAEHTHKDWDVPISQARFKGGSPADVATNHVVLKPYDIRSPNAAFDPQYTGSNIMGGLLAGGVGLGALGQSEDADAGFVTKGGKTLLEAWHGSPHKFDRFSMDQIGTGEGAQAYGHGLYFADSEDVARQYRDQLRHRGGEDFEDVAKRNGIDPSAFNGYGPHSAEARINEGASLKAIVTEAKMANRALRDTPDEQVAQTIQEYLDGKSGALYRTEIDVTPESLLDWDKPLSEQSEAVRGAMGDLAKQAESDAVSPSLLSKQVTGSDGVSRYADLRELDKIDGSSAHEILESIYGTSASGQLNNRGIKGIKYLDGDSRAAGNGTSNYVIFDDSLINIAERGSADPRLLAGTAAGTAGLLAAPALMKDGIFQHTASETPIVDRKEPVRNQSGLLESVTDFGDEVFKSVRHAAGPLADVFMPYEGVNNYLKTVNDYDKQPTWWDRLGILDL